MTPNSTIEMTGISGSGISENNSKISCEFFKCL
jgi:hypothetical protein